MFVADILSTKQRLTTTLIIGQRPDAYAMRIE
jgi:hypothetical protein